MTFPPNSCHRLFEPGFTRRAFCFALLLGAALPGGSSWCRAQSPQPPATPGATVSPGGSLTPAAGPGTPPAGTPATPPLDPKGKPDWAAYRAALTPAVSVLLTAPGAKSDLPGQSKNAKISKLAPPAPGKGASALVQPEVSGEAIGEINLGSPVGTVPPPAATVTLQFDVAHTGKRVWVQTLDGGSLQTPDAKAATIKAGGGCWIPLDKAGQLVFSFLPPAAYGRYQVLVRLGNVSTIVPFVVPDPAQDN